MRRLIDYERGWNAALATHAPRPEEV
jgi:hypothetical protein